MRRQFENYFLKALHTAKVEELADTYKKRGGEALKGFRSNGIEFDLVVQNKEIDTKIAFDVEFLPITAQTQSRIENLRSYAEQSGYDFRLITITKPTRYSIEIDWFYDRLLKYVLQNPIPEIEQKAKHVRYQSIEAELESIHVRGENAQVDAVGTIDVELQYDPDSPRVSNGKTVFQESFPYEGKFNLNLATASITGANITVEDNGW